MSTLEEIKARAEGHTEGPWEVVRGEWSTSNKRLTMVWDGQRDENEFMVATAFAESKANAELIAAAPKLLAALKVIQYIAAQHAARTPFPDADKESQWYSLGKQHAYERVILEIKEALQ